MSGERSEFIAHLVDLLAPLGEITTRRMFGGHGLYRHELMFGIVQDDTLYLKVDEGNRGGYEAHGLPAFTYARRGRRVALSFRLAPAVALEDGDTLCEWVRPALLAAARAAAVRSSRAKRPRAGAGATIC